MSLRQIDALLTRPQELRNIRMEALIHKIMTAREGIRRHGIRPHERLVIEEIAQEAQEIAAGEPDEAERESEAAAPHVAGAGEIEVLSVKEERQRLSCRLCFEAKEEKYVSKSCGHGFFCRDCVSELQNAVEYWALAGLRCPICRRVILEGFLRVYV
jgi:hypothetical protein